MVRLFNFEYIYIIFTYIAIYDEWLRNLHLVCIPTKNMTYLLLPSNQPKKHSKRVTQFADHSQMKNTHWSTIRPIWWQSFLEKHEETAKCFSQFYLRSDLKPGTSETPLRSKCGYSYGPIELRHPLWTLASSLTIISLKHTRETKGCRWNQLVYWFVPQHSRTCWSPRGPKNPKEEWHQAPTTG